MKYIREVDLANCLRNAVLTREELELISKPEFDYSKDEAIEILNILDRALASEQARMNGNHWSYNKVAHKSLVDAIEAESEILSAAKMAA